MSRYIEGFVNRDSFAGAHGSAGIIIVRHRDELAPSARVSRARVIVVEESEPDLRPGHEVETIDGVKGTVYGFPFRDDENHWCVVVDDIVWACRDLERTSPPDTTVQIQMRGNAAEVAEIRRGLERLARAQGIELTIGRAVSEEGEA